MNIGKKVRLNRIFSHPSGRLCSVAVDHFIGYSQDLPSSLRCIRETLAALVAGKPDAVTMQKGIALSAWEPFAGRTPMILQSTIGRPDDLAYQQLVTPEEAVRLGADAVAVAVFVRGKTEAEYLRVASDYVRLASRFDLPVICHIYPRRFTEAGATISFEPEDISWAVHCALEVGVDVIKVPYCGDVLAYSQIVSDTPTPVVAAGGPKQNTFECALEMIYDVVRSGARGATIGRNAWGFPQISAAVTAFRTIIHDGKTPQEALAAAGL